MAFLAVRRVKYEGDKYRYESPMLTNGINILVGDNGTGKSTFADLIYFGLGGRVDWFLAKSNRRHPEITGDRNNFIELLITIDDSTYTLKRFFGTNDVGVSGEDETEVYPLNRGEGREFIFSDWMLQKLDIEPVMLQYGTFSGKLNFTDLMRLIYHDQAPDPTGIFKSVENSSFVTDSRVFRRAIFEILIGRSFQDYYSALASFRTAERKRSEAAKALELFKEMAIQLQGSEEDLNIVFIDRKLTELRDQASRLLVYRAELAKAPPPSDTGADLAEFQRQLLTVQIRLSGFQRREIDLLDELSKLEQLKSELVLEATQIKKMMLAHEELGLFSANTCPYCLHDVERIPHKCICGREVKEGDYEKFFYDSGEYLTILKSKQKNVETVEAAAVSALDELTELRSEKAKTQAENEALEEQIRSAVEAADITVDLEQFEATENQLSEVRDGIAAMERQREVESRREQLEQEFKTASNSVDALRAKVNQLEVATETEIAEKRLAFSKEYNDLMRQTVTDCRTATIDSDYMPVLNGGEYKEASSTVAQRLLYYATMLYMSLIDTTVNFPRFLLIDTPETAGIDTDNLQDALSRVAEIVSNSNQPSQVILTTGVGKYPADVEATMIGTLTKTNDGRLLQLKAPSA